MEDLFRITEYGDPLDTFGSQYGQVEWRDWLGFEAERLHRDGIKTEIRTRKPDHFTALFRARSKSRTNEEAK